MGLLEDIRFPQRLSDGSAVSSRIQINSGTIVASSCSRIEKKYTSWARIPKSKWRALSVDEELSLISYKDNDETDVQLIRFPERVVGNIRVTKSSETATYKTKEAFSTLTTSKEYLAHLSELENYIKQYGTITKKALVCTNYPRLITTTTDDSKSMIGLHVDNWYRYPLSRRDKSPKRICINVGTDPRYLLLLNVRVNKMFDILERKGVKLHPSQVGTPLALAFMNEFPDYPVLRLRIEPEEGYIAPTENIVHDGSTIDMQSWDVAVHILGHFMM